jgi:hypothetical protein
VFISAKRYYDFLSARTDEFREKRVEAGVIFFTGLPGFVSKYIPPAVYKIAAEF